jgi:hypothetical protein
MEPNLQVTSGGNINPSRIVKISTAADNTVLISASATSPNIGVAQQGTRRAPGTGDDDGYAAIATENIGIYSAGSGSAPVEVGGTVTRGDFLTSDSAGKAIATTTEGDVGIGWGLQSGVAADILNFLCQPCFYSS